MWDKIKGKQLSGYKFRRQRVIDNFIIDFYCHELKLAIEIDGITHSWKEKYDQDRQNKLESLGIKFLRFSEAQTRRNLWVVLEIIKEWIKNNKENE